MVFTAQLKISNNDNGKQHQQEESHKYNVEVRNSDPKKYMMYDSINVKFNNRQNEGIGTYGISSEEGDQPGTSLGGAQENVNGNILFFSWLQMRVPFVSIY